MSQSVTFIAEKLSELFRQNKTEDIPTGSQELVKVLQEFESLYNSDPAKLLQAIRPEYYWYFFIDGKLLQKEKGWLGFEEREPGYLLAMTKAFQRLFQPYDNLNSLIKNLHLIATQSVDRTNYDNVRTEKKGFYRSLNGINQIISGCPLHYENTSDLGLAEIIQSIRKQNYQKFLQVLAVRDMRDESDIYFIVPDKISSFGNNFRIEHITENTYLMLKNLLTSNRASQLILIYLPLDSTGQLLQNGNQVMQAVDAGMISFINDYYDSINKATTPYVKFIISLLFIQQCERFHPFIDAVTRIHSMELLKRVLMDNALPLMICNLDPNRIAGYSCNELILECVETMKKTLRLAKGIEPYDLKTSDILLSLDKPQKEYFDEVVKTAKELQQQLVSRPLSSIQFGIR